MNKAEILQQIRNELQAQYDRIAGAANEARDYATDADSKAESKYDTRGLEASYLAAGQAAKADELAESIRVFTMLDLPDFAEGDPIAIGALVEVHFEGTRTFYLLAPHGGGTTCEHDGAELTVLSPNAPLFARLAGRRRGEKIADSGMKILGVA